MGERPAQQWREKGELRAKYYVHHGNNGLALTSVCLYDIFNISTIGILQLIVEPNAAVGVKTFWILFDQEEKVKKTEIK